MSSPPHEDFPYAKNPKLSVNVEGWEEQPVVMRIFWFGMFQLACLACWVLLFFYGLTSLFGIPTTIIFVVIGTPLLKEPVGRWVVALVGHQLDTIWSMLMLKFFITSETAIVHDGLLCQEGINLMRTTYNDKQHSLFVIYPCLKEDSHKYTNPEMEYSWTCWNVKRSDEATIKTTLETKALDKGGIGGHAIVYVHGGGFVAANAAVLIQQAVTMTREGITVYAIDYPLSPGDPFPNAILSVLDSLKWLQTYRKVDRVSLVGDSAGGSLVSYAAALATSPELLKSFGTEMKTTTRNLNYDTQDFPNIVGLASVYGVLDAETFRNRLEKMPWLEWKTAVYGLSFCIDCYYNPKHADYPQHFCDLWTHPKTSAFINAKAFPPTLLLCGDKDPLIQSTYKAAQLLHEHKVHTIVKIFAARHGFVGFPRAWINAELKSQAAQADAAIRSFLVDRNTTNNTKQEVVSQSS
jgi:acetyl esterase/lipase